MLAGIGGYMNGWAEGVRALVWQGDEVLSVRSKAGSLWGSVISGELKTNTGVHSFVLGSDGEIESSVDSSRINDAVHPSNVRLAGTAEAFCFLTGVSGDFDGRGESIVLEQRDGSWVMRAKAGDDGSMALFTDGQKQLRGHARCVSYQQF